MARPSKAEERRQELLPFIAAAFSELGYRRATTAELAARCAVQENVLYRLWQDKKAMFVASIEFLFARRMSKWRSALAEKAPQDSRSSSLIELTGKNLGEQGLYRIIFAALSETDDPEVKQALKRLYRRYHTQVENEIAMHRGQQDIEGLGNEETAWALIGLVAFMNIALDLDLISSQKRQRMFTRMAHFLLNGETV